MHDEEFDAQIREYRDYLTQWMLKQMDKAEDAEDLVQDILVKAYAHKDSFRGDSSMKTWLTAIASNALVDWYRRKQKHAEPLSLDEPIHKHVYTITGLADGYVTRGELLEDKRECINPYVMLENAETTQKRIAIINQTFLQLSEKLRSILALYMQGLTQQQIAESLGIPVGTVKSRLNRAQSKFSILAEDEMLKQGIIERRRERTLSDEQEEHIVRRYKNGEFISNLCWEYNVQPDVLRYIIHVKKGVSKSERCTRKRKKV